jgi:hypothetical protein
MPYFASEWQDCAINPALDNRHKEEENVVMSDTNKQARQRKIRGYVHDFGKFLVDIAKLAFGSLVLVTAIRWDIPHKTLFFVGIVFSFSVAFAGILLTRKYEEKYRQKTKNFR